MGDAFAALDATGQAALVREGEVTPIELVDAAIARVERLDPELHAVIHPLFDKARDVARSPVLAAGPFRGVPFLVKDAVCHTAGDPYHVGMRFLKERGFVADADSELARRFRAAGFVFIGKTNTPELAMSVTCEPLAYGPSHNPWNVSRSTGGSSGGSAAAVAAGLVPVAHANDMGGSIRIPASFCGLVGLKPTRARATLAPAFGEYWGPLTHEHVLTRSVRDSGAVLDAIAGPAVGDPYTAPPPRRAYRQDVVAGEQEDAGGASSQRLRIGFTTGTAAVASAPEVAATVERVAGWLAELGHEVKPTNLPPLDHPEVGPWIPAGVARDLERWSERLGEPIGSDDVEPATWLMAEAGRAMSAVDYVRSAESAQAWSRSLQRIWGDALDVLVTPTTPELPPRIGELSPTVEPATAMVRMAALTTFTMPFDVTGQPAISLPLGMSADGLPIGVQLVAATGREDILFRLAARLEAAHSWASRRAALHA